MSDFQERERSPVRQLVRRAAVLGAGTMGSQIAALLANHGIVCDLLDLQSPGRSRSRLADEAKQRLLDLRPPPLISPEALDLVHPGNFADDLECLSEADWVIEAVTEQLYIKRMLWSQAGPYLRRNAIASTNTSAISIAAIAQALPQYMRSRFLGTHFFNPPRYLKLLEIIPGPDTDPAVVSDIRRFAQVVLDKGVVLAHDVPGFIANRIGCYAFLSTMRAMKEHGLTIDQADAVTGPLMGRPRSATFRTLDLVGLDVFVDICEHIGGSVSERWEQAAFEVPHYVRLMLSMGMKGEKSGQGFYKREKDDDGRPQVFVLDVDSMQYVAQQPIASPALAAVREMPELADRLRTLVQADYPAAHFAWRVLSETLEYAARMVGEVADDITSIDQAFRWGFGWSLGPFETWDMLGVAGTARRMRDDGLTLPPWVLEVASEGGSFYSSQVAFRGR